MGIEDEKKPFESKKHYPLEITVWTEEHGHEDMHILEGGDVKLSGMRISQERALELLNTQEEEYKEYLRMIENAREEILKKK
jgi:hypothetical protein